MYLSVVEFQPIGGTISSMAQLTSWSVNPTKELIAKNEANRVRSAATATLPKNESGRAMENTYGDKGFEVTFNLDYDDSAPQVTNNTLFDVFGSDNDRPINTIIYPEGKVLNKPKGFGWVDYTNAPVNGNGRNQRMTNALTGTGNGDWDWDVVTASDLV